MLATHFFIFKGWGPIDFLYSKIIQKHKSASSSIWGVKLGVFHDPESNASICFAQKTFLGQKIAPTVAHTTVKSDDSSLNHSFVVAFLAQGSWKTPSLTPHLLLKADLFCCIILLYRKSMGPQPYLFLIEWLTCFSEQVGPRHCSCQIWCLYHKVNDSINKLTCGRLTKYVVCALTTRPAGTPIKFLFFLGSFFTQGHT